MPYNNLKVLKELKKKGKKVGKLRYKKYMQFKMGLPFAPVEMERIRVIKYPQALSYPQEPLWMPATSIES